MKNTPTHKTQTHAIAHIHTDENVQATSSVSLGKPEKDTEKKREKTNIQSIDGHINCSDALYRNVRHKQLGQIVSGVQRESLPL